MARGLNRDETSLHRRCAFRGRSFPCCRPAGRSVSGNYMEARTADVYTGPCFANGEVDINGKEAVFGWKINNGAWKGVNAAGLGVVGVVSSKYTLGSMNRPDNPATAVLIVDSRATAEQRDALVAFAKSRRPTFSRTS